MSDSNYLPLTLRSLPDNGFSFGEIDAEKIVCLPLPRNVVRHAVGTAIRLKDLHLETSPSHVNDLVMYGLILKVLARPNLVF